MIGTAASRKHRCGLLLPALLLGFVPLRCATSPSDSDRVRTLMGRNDRLLLETQLAAADDVDAAGIRACLQEMAENLEQAGRFRPFAEEWKNREYPRAMASAVDRLRDVVATEWTPQNREDSYIALRAICSQCHSRLVEAAHE